MTSIVFKQKILSSTVLDRDAVLEEADSSEDMVASSEADFEANEAEGQDEPPKEDNEETGE